MKYVFLLAVAMLAFSCGRNDESSGSRVGVAGGGGVVGPFDGSTIAGTLRILSDCQASVGTIAIGTVGSTYSSSSRQVQNGGSFDFRVNPGTYQLYATAGTCSVSGQVGTLSGNVQPYSICLGSACQSGQYKMTKMSASEMKTVFKADDDAGPYCAWNVYGCQGQIYPGTGNVIVGPSNIFLKAKSETAVTLNLEYSKGNNAFAAIPSLGSKGWNVTVKTDGSLAEGSINHKALSYDAQVDDKLLQFSDGFCDKRENLVARMAKYLSVSGFSENSVADFTSTWEKHMPVNPTICVYPQGEEQIQKTVNYKSSVALEARRLWFILVPQLETAVARIRPIPYGLASYALKPKTDAFVEAKKALKTRKIANDAALLAEEIAVGFLIER